jgi:hypothetical protein
MEHSQSPGTTILRLPDELLAPLLQESVHVEHETWRDDDSKPFLKSCDATTARALISTCRRFRRLVTPLLYANIQIQCNGVNDAVLAAVHSTRLLHRTFRTNTSLWPHCRRLEIEFDASGFGDEPFDPESPVQNLIYVASDCLNWLTNTLELRIKGWPQSTVYGYQPRSLLLPTRDDLLYLIRLAIDNLPRLRHLRLHTFRDAMLDLSTVLTGLSGLKPDRFLQTLDLSGITHTGTDDDWKLLRVREHLIACCLEEPKKKKNLRDGC